MLPDWERAVRAPRTRELWWRGVPDRARGEAWTRAIGNELGLTPQTFAAARARAAAVAPYAAPPSHGDAGAEAEKPSPEQSWLRAIPRDAARTLPALGLFQPAQPLHRPLVDLLAAYAFYRADVGHAPSTCAPAALLLLAGASPPAAFVALANLLNRPVPLAFATRDAAGMARACERVGAGLRAARPRLHARLFGRVEEGGLGMGLGECLEPMLATLFLHRCGEVPPSRRPPPSSASPHPPSTRPPPPSALSPPPPPPPTSSSPPPSSSSPSAPASTGLPLPLAQRLWDILLFDGDAGLVRCAVGVLAAAERALYGSREEVLRVLGWRGAGFAVGFGGAGAGQEEEEEKEEERVEAFVGVVREVGRRRREERGEDGPGLAGRE